MKKEIVKTLLAIGIGVSSLTTNIYATSSISEEKGYYYEQKLVMSLNSSSSSSGSPAWYYNTGTSLPKEPDYSKI